MNLQVITPVGPGHEHLKDRALESVRVAIEYDKGPFEDVRVLAIDDTAGEMGRSAARNEAVKAATAEWLFFLDADDLMHPKALYYFGHEGKDYQAVWGTIIEMRSGVYHERYQVPEIYSMAQLLSHDPYITLQMGHFVKREVALATPFNEKMDTGEDWDYYLRVWENYYATKIECPFMINVRGQHSTGPRSADGAQWRQAVTGVMENARQSIAG